MKKNEELLAKHPYKIWEGTDGKWHTYLPDKEKGRVPKKRKTEAEIKAVVADFWRQEEENPTVEDIFKVWLDKKVARGDIEKSTRDRYKRQFEQCFTEFRSRRIKTIDEMDVEEFVLDTIGELDLTQKAYSNMRTLLYGIFRYAKKHKYVNYSITEVVGDIEFSKNTFKKVVRSDEELVFTEDELPRVLEELSKDLDLINLGLILMFKTGMRIGELAALRPSSINQNVVSITATEIVLETITTSVSMRSETFLRPRPVYEILLFQRRICGY